MFFPDPRKRVATPDFPLEVRQKLEQRRYQEAFVEFSKAPVYDFAFLRPPGWEIKEGLLSPDEDLPFPSICSIRRNNPNCAIEILVTPLPFDCLPGDFLDAATQARALSEYSQGEIGMGFYADRMGKTKVGYEVVAAHRIGQMMHLFLVAIKKGTVTQLKDQVNTIIGSYSPREGAHPFFIDAWVDLKKPLAFKFQHPKKAKIKKVPGGFAFHWDVPGGPNVLDARVPTGRQRQMDVALDLLAKDLNAYGVDLDLSSESAADMPAAEGGVLEGEVQVRRFDAVGEESREVLWVQGQNAKGKILRLISHHPQMEVHSHAWMRGRFFLNHALRTLRA
jgi:hypothetical protein